MPIRHMTATTARVGQHRRGNTTVSAKGGWREPASDTAGRVVDTLGIVFARNSDTFGRS